MIKNLLEYLNFSQKESRVYLSLLEVGSEIAAEIGKKTGLNRTTVYDILDELIQKGLVSKFKKGSKTYFQALDPKRLLNYLDREKEDQAKIIEKQKKKVQEFLPELISLQNPLSTKPKVQFFEGKFGMREAYEDTLSSKETILAYANLETMYEGLSDYFPEYFKRRAKAKIFIRAIFADNHASRECASRNQEELRATRFFPKGSLPFTPEINLYNNKMLVASWHEKMAVIIESKELVDLQKFIFEIVWNSLPRNGNL